MSTSVVAKKLEIKSPPRQRLDDRPASLANENENDYGFLFIFALLCVTLVLMIQI